MDGLRKRYAEELFAPLSLVLHPGEGLGVFGYNGSGKTTLLDMLSGLLKPTAGSFTREGACGYCMQHTGFQDSLTFKENLLLEAYLCGLKGTEAQQRTHEVAARCDLLSFWKKRYRKGSSGMQGRLRIAAALLMRPRLLLLDEAFNFLDERSVEHMRHVLLAEKERGAALVMVSHNRDDFTGLCERVLYLPEARIEAL
jgi:ABC-type multidrug transport system ATPase subunit